MRTSTALLCALLLSTAHAQDQGTKPLSQIELNAWGAYCSSELDGNSTLCACVLEKQFEQNDQNVVKGSLLQMVDDDPNATDSDNAAAQDALTEMYSGDTAGALEDLQDFKNGLADNIKACTPKDE